MQAPPRAGDVRGSQRGGDRGDEGVLCRLRGVVRRQQLVEGYGEAQGAAAVRAQVQVHPASVLAGFKPDLHAQQRVPTGMAAAWVVRI